MQVNSQARETTAATAVANAAAAAAAATAVGNNTHRGGKHDRSNDGEDNGSKSKRLRSDQQLAEALTAQQHANNTDPLLDAAGTTGSGKFYDPKDNSIQSSLVSEAVQRHVQKIVEQSQLASRNADSRMESAFQTTNNQRPVSPPPLSSKSDQLDHHHDHHDGHDLSESGGLDKPQVGSDEWHKMRRDNHKEVERRRRDNINKGINLLAEVVPECDKQKGQILKKAHEYIVKLKTAEAQNLEKYTLEKLLSEQAISELSATNKNLKVELNQAWRECNVWKKACERHGITDPNQ